MPKISATRKAAKQSEIQMIKLAATRRGHIMDDPLTSTPRITKIRARGPNSKNAYTEIKRALDCGEEVLRTSLKFTERELSTLPDSAAVDYIIVGYTLATEDENWKITPKGSLAKAVGTKRPAHTIAFKNGEAPLLVVVRVTETPAEMIKYAALIHSDDGLCTPWSISQRQVFFRAEFRDNATSSGSREKNWVAKVREQSTIGETVQDLSETQKKSKAGKEQSRVSYPPPAENIGLHKFCDVEAEFGKLDAQRMVKEVHESWPKIAMNEDIAMSMKKALTEGWILLAYESLGSVLKLATKRMGGRSDIETAEMVEMMQGARDDVDLILEE
jgi:hypothetical protein